MPRPPFGERESSATIETLERRNQLILRCAGEGIYGLDREGLTTFVNPAAAEMLGWTAQRSDRRCPKWSELLAIPLCCRVPMAAGGSWPTATAFRLHVCWFVAKRGHLCGHDSRFRSRHDPTTHH
jgi:PAS domain-containing protein